MADISLAVLDLPIKERAALIDKLYDSIDSELNAGEKNGILKAWGAESEKRIEAVERGELKTVDAAAALMDFRGSLKK